MHTLQAVIANLEALDHLHFNLNKLNILNLWKYVGLVFRYVCVSKRVKLTYFHYCTCIFK